jgi:two-component system CheB/CheR fusion protein
VKGCDNIVKTKTEDIEKVEKSNEKQVNNTKKNLGNNLLDSDMDSNKSPEKNFPIVGIGASAGGLAAFESFFSTLPTNTKLGMAFVLVQHLDPNHTSILASLVKHYTQLPVYEVTEGMIIQPDSIYVIPPNYDMVIEDGVLHLKKPIEAHGFRLPIDLFFRSLAQQKQEKAIGIIFSGTGSDGTLGVRMIKGAGGIVMVQRPESSEYDGMPRSAIATGMVDYILTPAEMSAKLIAYNNQKFEKIQVLTHKTESGIKKIFNILNTKIGHDFSNYKEKTIIRRVERRMNIKNFKNVDEYAQYLEQNLTEVEALFHDFLIGITSFFREPQAFETFQTKIIPQLFTNRNLDSVIRIWVPGCSTGEEAYSIGILFQEQMEILKQVFKVLIFATDIDAKALETARKGVYPPSILADVSSERLDRFFTQESDGNYHIKKTIRDMVIFSNQDTIKDPPFSKLDLLSCRNLMIYMNKELQKKLISIFYYALKSDGILFLGSSETLGDLESFFEIIDPKAKLYRKKNTINELLPIGTFASPQLKSKETLKPFSKTPIESKFQLRELIEQTILQHNTPVGVLVNQHGDILYLHGRTGKYLELTSGEVNLNILKMAREGLRQELIIDLHKAVVHKEPVFHPGLQVKTNGDFTAVNIVIRPVNAGFDTAAETKLFVITFEEMRAWEKDQKEKVVTIGVNESTFDNTTADDTRILELKRELQIKEELLKAANEELETSNEELKSYNEEMQSINEELQSTNEELETSKEELQ